ncbi:MAG: glycosyltransferase [Maribacter sp.]|nr:glycosyltransferase [Maribacter sp.]
MRFCGPVSGEAKNRAYLEADVCVIPSYSENFCIVVAEALSMGMPVIVSDSLAWGEVEARGCGLVVGNDPDSLAGAIYNISRMELSRMGVKGWQWMKQDYSWDTIAKEMANLYQLQLI